MAKKLEECKKEFDRIQKGVDDGNDVVGKTMQWTGQVSGIMKEACKEIGRRVQELKDKGATGTSIDDFKTDPEVKEHLNYIEGYMTRTEAEIKKVDVLRDGAAKSLATDFWDLKKELEAEVAHRKKKKAGFFKIDSKSLPDLEKLLAEMNKYKDSKSYIAFTAIPPESIDDHRQDVQGWIADELSKAKDARLSGDQQDMAERALDLRILKGNLNRAKSIADEIAGIVDEAASALSSKDTNALNAAKVKAAKLFKELHEMAALYKRASEDQWIKARVAESKNKSTIAQAMTAISTLHQKAGGDLKKIAGKAG